MFFEFYTNSCVCVFSPAVLMRTKVVSPNVDAFQRQSELYFDVSFLKSLLNANQIMAKSKDFAYDFYTKLNSLWLFNFLPTNTILCVCYQVTIINLAALARVTICHLSPSSCYHCHGDLKIWFQFCLWSVLCTFRYLFVFNSNFVR